MQAERRRNIDNAKGQAQISKSIASETQRMTEAIRSVLTSMLHHTNSYLVSEILSPAIRSSVSEMPVPPDPKDVDNTPPLLPKGNEALCSQMRKASDAVYNLARTTEQIYERLERAEKDCRSAVNKAELDGTSASGAGSGDNDAYHRRSKRADAQGAEEMEQGKKSQETKQKRSKETESLTRPLMDRVVKWEKDRVNELLLRGAQGPGGAAFLSGAMGTKHSTAMGVRRRFL